MPDAEAGARKVPFVAPALYLLTSLPPGSPDAPLWTDDLTGRALTYWQVNKAWRRIRRCAGLEGVRLHDLRHTVGTHAGQNGLNAFMVRDLLRH